jgi:hypothetical protein
VLELGAGAGFLSICAAALGAQRVCVGCVWGGGGAFIRAYVCMYVCVCVYILYKALYMAVYICLYIGMYVYIYIMYTYTYGLI